MAAMTVAGWSGLWSIVIGLFCKCWKALRLRSRPVRRVLRGSRCIRGLPGMRLMGSPGCIYLAGGRECKLVTGIDDHSRFVVMAQVVSQPSARTVCQAFTEALTRYGVPSEVLTDNGKQFTCRFTKPLPAEVLFERISWVLSSLLLRQARHR